MGRLLAPPMCFSRIAVGVSTSASSRWKSRRAARHVLRIVECSVLKNCTRRNEFQFVEAKTESGCGAEDHAGWYDYRLRRDGRGDPTFL